MALQHFLFRTENLQKAYSNQTYKMINKICVRAFKKSFNMIKKM